MSLDLLLAVAGVAVTIMVVAAMVLIVPGGVEKAPPHRADPLPEPVVDEAPAQSVGVQGGRTSAYPRGKAPRRSRVG